MAASPDQIVVAEHSEQIQAAKNRFAGMGLRKFSVTMRKHHAHPDKHESDPEEAQQ